MAFLTVGLRANSRVMMAMNDMQLSPENTLLAVIIDKLNLLLWMNTKDGQKNRNRPESILSHFKGNKDIEVFTSADEFERERRIILGKGE